MQMVLRARGGGKFPISIVTIALLCVSVPTAVCLLRDAPLRSDGLPTSEEFCFGEAFGVFKVSWRCRWLVEVG